MLEGPHGEAPGSFTGQREKLELWLVLVVCSERKG